MEMNFCRRCGTPLAHKGGNAYTCTNSHQLYVNAAPTVGVFLIADDGQVLLARRGIEPGKGLLDTFGGFADGIGVEDGYVALPQIPGVGFEAKAELSKLMRELAEG